MNRFCFGTEPGSDKAAKLLVWLVAAILLVISTSAAIASDLKIEGVRFGINQDKTRLVLELDRDVKATVFALDGPNRIVIDLPGAEWKAGRSVPVRGVVSKFRYGMFNPETFRVVLDLNSPAVVQRSFVMKPSGGGNHRLVIDLQKASVAVYADHVRKTKAARMAADESVRSSQKAPPKSRPKVAAKKPESTRNSSPRRIVMIDPGHGGNDPGNLGSIGVYEKVIALSISKEIVKSLNATGRYDARLTRNRDYYISHKERYQAAEKAGAELFISIHADSIANPSHRGASVYTLNKKGTDVQARRVAAMENQSDILAGVEEEEFEDDVVGILADLALTETLNFSAQFAEYLVPELKRETRVLGNAHRGNNLKVLKSYTVPSVLLETGYLTNKTEARFLNSAAGRQKIASAVQRAVDRYFADIVAMGR